jgi:predicted esterase YcpF (UPF0227 family)
MNNPIVYLPGFNSGPQSEKSAQLKLHFHGLVAATYDTWNPDNGFKQIDTLLRPLLQDQPLLVGSSLGGFWAYQFAKKYDLKCVLLNPCMTPEVSLKPSVGKVENFYTGATGILTLEDLLKYPGYRLTGAALGPMHCTVLHEKGDEVIPYQESVENFAGKAKLVLLEGGNHRFAQLDVAIREIRQLQNSN